MATPLKTNHGDRRHPPMMIDIQEGLQWPTSNTSQRTALLMQNYKTRKGKRAIDKCYEKFSTNLYGRSKPQNQIPNNNKKTSTQGRLRTMATEAKRGRVSAGDASPSKGAQKKKKDREEDEEMIDEPPEKPKPRDLSTVFGGPEIQIIINHQKYDVTVQLDEKKAEEAKVKFKGTFGEGPFFVHDVHRKAVVIAKKFATKNATVVAKDLMENGMTVEEWLTTFTAVATNNYEEEEMNLIVPEEGIIFLKVFMSRLANTPPSTLFGAQLKNSKMPSTVFSRAWYGAVMSIGSQYKQVRKATMQTKLSFAQATKPKDNDQQVQDAAKGTEGNQSKIVSFGGNTNNAVDLTTAPNQAGGGQVAQTLNLVSPPTKNQAPVNAQTANATPQRSTTRRLVSTKKRSANEVRLLLKIYNETSGKESPNEAFMKKIKDLFYAYYQEMKSVQLLPWKDSGDKPVVNSPEDMPTKVADLQPYTDRLRIVNKKAMWFKMRFATDDPELHLSSMRGSSMLYWFDENQSAAYPCTVQKSDDTVDMGDLIYSGMFVDHVRVTNEIQKACKRLIGHELKFGCRTKKSLEIPMSTGKKTNWTMADNSPIHIEVDRQQAKMLKAVLYKAFNKTDDRADRPGGYSFRMVPSKEHLMVGSGGDKKRTATLRKHQAVIQSLALIKNCDIRELDTEYVSCGKTYTLRGVLLDLQYPLGKTEENTSALIHTVDTAASGEDHTHGIVYCTAYKDRVNMAENLIAILPAYIKYLIDLEAAKAWFHATSHNIINEVEFHCNDDGEWLGTWTTSEDEINDTILNEDLGFQIQLEGLDLLQDAGHVALRADEASLCSFGKFLNQGPQPQTGGQEGSAGNAETPDTQGPQDNAMSSSGAGGGGP